MDSDRWKRVEQLYNQLVSLSPQDRARLLDAASPSADVRREVESLLAARDDAGDFLSPADLKATVADIAGPAPGARLGDYEILGVLGIGGMGEVYRARDTRLGREVALKILPATLTGSPARVARFQSEARAASALNHPNSVTIYEIGQANGTWFIAAELIEGGTLRDRMQAGKLPIAEAVNLILPCAATLQAAHNAAIVHRDIKPENIMVRIDGSVKIVDFGLARILQPGPDWTPDATQTGTIMGTPRYMSPEQARGHKPDGRSDIFSLAAVLYELVTAQPAFPGATAPEVFVSLLGAEPDFTPTGPLRPILTKALAKDPAARYRSMDEFAAALQSLDPSGPQRKRRLLAPLTTAALLLLGSFAVWGWLHRPTVSALSVTPLSKLPGPKSFPAISPDGNRIAFSWLASGSSTRHLYIQAISGGDPVRLTSATLDDLQSAWSPDGRQIAFTRQFAKTGSEIQDVFVIPAGGGVERKVGQTWRGLSWAPDGQHLAVTRIPSSNPAAETAGIGLIDITTGQSQAITTGFRDSFPVFSHDGQWIAFKRQATSSTAQLYVTPANGGAIRQLTFDPIQPFRAPAWAPGSLQLIFTALRSGANGTLWRVPIAGGPPQSISAKLHDAVDPTTSSTRLAYVQEWMDTNLYLYTASDFSRPQLVANAPREDHSPDLSPDGERIAFTSDRSGNLEIWTARRDGTRPVQLTHLRAQNIGTPRWSPDGTRIAFDSWIAGRSAISVVAADGGIPQPLTGAGLLDHWMAAWLPDGHSLCVARGVTGATDIWRIPADPSRGTPVQLTHTGAFECKPSPDGRLIYYAKPDQRGGRTIWSVPADGGTETPVPELQAFNRIGRSWGVTRQGIYFVSYEDAPAQPVRLLSFATRQVTSLFRLPRQRQWGTPALTFSLDGRYAVAAQLDDAASNLMRIDDFR